MAIYKLTNLGKLAYKYTILTPPNYWGNLLKEANILADDGGEWELMVEERIAGLTEFLETAKLRGLMFYDGG